MTNVNIYRYDTSNSKDIIFSSPEINRGKHCRSGLETHLRTTSKKCRFYGLSIEQINASLLNETILNNQQVELIQSPIPSQIIKPQTSKGSKRIRDI